MLRTADKTLFRRTTDERMIENEQTFYDTYVFIYQSSFKLQKKSMLFSALMAGEPWGWRVIGITEGALNAFAEFDYKYTKGLVCRAHLVDRIETAKAIFSELIPRQNFFRRYFETDGTVIALKSENTTGGPSKYIPIDPERKLFLSRQVGFTHAQSEREYLRDLHAAYRSGEIAPMSRLNEK